MSTGLAATAIFPNCCKVKDYLNENKNSRHNTWQKTEKNRPLQKNNDTT